MDEFAAELLRGLDALCRIADALEEIAKPPPERIAVKPDEVLPRDASLSVHVDGDQIMVKFRVSSEEFETIQRNMHWSRYANTAEYLREAALHGPPRRGC